MENYYSERNIYLVLNGIFTNKKADGIEFYYFSSFPIILISNTLTASFCK